MNSSSKLQSLLPKNRWQRRLLEVALIFVVIVGARYWETHGLPDGAAPPLVGVLTNGSVARVGAGATATPVVFLSAQRRNARLRWAETSQA